jgi:hypothetical protein
MLGDALTLAGSGGSARHEASIPNGSSASRANQPHPWAVLTGFVLVTPAYPLSPAAEARFRAAHAEVMARLPAPTGAEVVPTGFGRVYVYRFGGAAGVPLVLLPGRAGSTTMWEPQLPAWSRSGPSTRWKSWVRRA